MIEQYMKLCEKLRAKSQGLMAELDHSALMLDDNNIARFADKLRNSHQPVPVLSLNLSRIGTTSKRRCGSSAGGSTWLPDGLDRLLHYIQTSPFLVDVRLSGSESTAKSTVLLQAVITHVMEAIENNPYIRRLGLFNVGLEVESVARHVRRTKTLQHLSIVRCTFYKRGLKGGGGACNENFTQCTQKMVASFALNKSITSLRVVELDENITLSILDQLKAHGTIQKLDVSCHTSAVASMVGQLVSGQKIIASNLTHLILRDSALQGFESIVRLLTSGMSPINRLDLVNCSIDAVSASLFRTLFRSSKHQIHNVSFCDTLLSDDTVLEDIFDGLLQSKTINQLTLHHVTLQERDYQALNHLLQTDKILTQVNLDRTILAYMERQGRRRISDQCHAETQQCGGYVFSRESENLCPSLGATLTTV